MTTTGSPKEKACEALEKIERFFLLYKRFKESLEQNEPYSSMDPSASAVLVGCYEYNHQNTIAETNDILTAYAAENP